MVTHQHFSRFRIPLLDRCQEHDMLFISASSLRHIQGQPLQTYPHLTFK